MKIYIIFIKSVKVSLRKYIIIFFNDTHYYNKKQFVTNHLTNYITTKNSITNTENVLNIRKDFSTKHGITNVFRSNNDYMGNNTYKKYGNRAFNNTDNITKHVNNYRNDVTNSYNINKTQSLNKTYYNFNDDITLKSNS